MNKPEEILPSVKEEATNRKKLLGMAALAVVFGAAVGGGTGYTMGKDAAYPAAEAQLVKKYEEKAFSQEFAAGAKYSHLCWSFRQLADKEGKRTHGKKPALIEMNAETARECPLQSVPRVKPKIVY